jgi:hypothetical protein
MTEQLIDRTTRKTDNGPIYFYGTEHYCPWLFEQERIKEKCRIEAENAAKVEKKNHDDRT